MSYFIISSTKGILTLKPSPMTLFCIPPPNLLKIIALSPGSTLYIDNYKKEYPNNADPANIIARDD